MAARYLVRPDRERPGNYIGERSAEVGRVGRKRCAYTVKLKRPIGNDNLFVLI
jgi:hypothetical protein